MFFTLPTHSPSQFVGRWGGCGWTNFLLPFFSFFFGWIPFNLISLLFPQWGVNFLGGPTPCLVVNFCLASFLPVFSLRMIELTTPPYVWSLLSSPHQCSLTLFLRVLVPPKIFPPPPPYFFFLTPIVFPPKHFPKKVNLNWVSPPPTGGSPGFENHSQLVRFFRYFFPPFSPSAPPCLFSQKKTKACLSILLFTIFPGFYGVKSLFFFKLFPFT